MQPSEALDRIAFLLERAREATYRVRAFRRASDVVNGLSADELAARISSQRLQQLPGIGETTAGVITDAASGTVPAYLAKLEEDIGQPVTSGGATMRSALRGDLHTHSDWSDGGSPIRRMALTARDLGHEYIALTDHSPRLTVANGLSSDRLRAQLEVVEELNSELAPFRILSGIEVDILDDGALDQEPELLALLDVVVASVHSKLRMESAPMTARMINAIRNPNMDILGHCTGRMVVGRGRPQSQFDAEAVFAACIENGVAVEINSRPERLDPPMRLLELATDMGAVFSIDTDAHAPGQLDWQLYGCERAEAAGVSADRVANARSIERLTEWTSSHHPFWP